MKKSGKCPKCSSNEIYNNQELLNKGHRAHVGISNWSSFQVTSYLCVNCGYIEEYMCDKHMNDQRKLVKLKEKWTKYSKY